MRRIVLGLFLLLVTLPVFAQDANVQITSPQANTNLTGIVTVTGTVNPPDLQQYFFEVANAAPENQGEILVSHAYTHFSLSFPQRAARSRPALPSRNS